MLSIVILCYNSPAHEKICIDSVIKHTTIPHEIILVNNNGSKESKDQCKEYSKKEGIKYVELQENKSVANGWNMGIRYCKYPYIAVLNNDLMLTKNWDKKLLKPFTTHPNVAMTGPTLSYCATKQRDNDAYKICSRMKERDVDSFSERYDVLYKDKEYEVNILSGSCFVTTREMYDRIGPFDEDFKVGSGEEAEWEHRALRKGLFLIWVRHCFVHHFGHVSFSRRELEEPSFNSNKIWKENAELYRKKIAKGGK